jgi:molybdopterin/thiamine biosynthesis adenylyltransferase
MSHLFQVGVGSGGMVVLDLVARDPRVTRVTLVEPDVYAPHNVHRHVFPASAVGGLKAELAAQWVRERRPDLAFKAIVADLTDPARQDEFARLAAACDVGVCAVDNEPAKFAFDALLRAAGKPWTLGEVLSGGIGGWVHRFTPGGPCYGCVSSYLQRNVTEEPTPPSPDYANPGAGVAETTVPASKASISAIASLHAVATLELLANPDREGGGEAHPVADAPGSPGSILLTLTRVPGVFEEAFRTYRFRVPKSPACLICAAAVPAGDLDVALGEALGRLGPQ